MRWTGLPITANLQSVRIFYGLVAAQNSCFLGWGLREMNNAPHFQLGNLPLHNVLFLGGVVITSMAAAFPSVRAMRIMAFLLSLYAFVVIYLWHGLWPEKCFEVVITLLLALSTFSLATAFDRRVTRNVIDLSQILLCGFLLFHASGKISGSNASTTLVAFEVMTIVSMVYALYDFWRKRLNPPNFAMLFTLIFIGEYFLAHQAPLEITALLVAIWYQGIIQNKIPASYKLATGKFNEIRS